MPMLKLRQLIYLRKAIEAGNITKAADGLHIAQTALGLQIRNLEDELGVVLLERHSRGVAPTPAGALLSEHAEEILALVEKACAEVRALSDGPIQTVSLGVTPSIIRLVGDDIITELSMMIPGISLRVVEDFSFVLMRALDQGELDCVLTYSPTIDDSSYKRIALLEEDLCCITSPDMDQERGGISFKEVLAKDLALTGRSDAVSQIVEQIAQRLGLELKVAYEVQSIRAVKNLVEKGIAATIMPYGAAEGELRKGKLIARPITLPAVTRTLAYVYPKNAATTAASPAFIELIHAIVKMLLEAPGPIMRKL